MKRFLYVNKILSITLGMAFSLILFCSLPLCKHKFLSTGTPLQFISRDKSSSACRSIGSSIKKHIFHKTPKRDINSPLIKVPITPLGAQVSLHTCNEKN